MKKILVTSCFVFLAASFIATAGAQKVSRDEMANAAKKMNDAREPGIRNLINEGLDAEAQLTEIEKTKDVKKLDNFWKFKLDKHFQHIIAGTALGRDCERCKQTPEWTLVKNFYVDLEARAHKLDQTIRPTPCTWSLKMIEGESFKLIRPTGPALDWAYEKAEGSYLEQRKKAAHAQFKCWTAKGDEA